MAENVDKKLDQLIDMLAADVAGGTPRPGPDLAARVLADAAGIAAARPQPVVATPPAAEPRASGIMDMLFGWTTGAVAAVALALLVGIGAGLQMDANDLPFMEDDSELTMADGGFLPEDVL